MLLCTSGAVLSRSFISYAADRTCIAAGTRSRFIGFRARAAPFFQVTGRWRSSRVLIYHLPAPAPKSFNKRLRQIPYCGLRAAAVFLLFQPFDRSNRLSVPFLHRPGLSHRIPAVADFHSLLWLSASYVRRKDDARPWLRNFVRPNDSLAVSPHRTTRYSADFVKYRFP